MKDQQELNREAYSAVKKKLEATDFGRTVLLHDGEVIAIYNDSGDAYAIGCEKFGLAARGRSTFSELRWYPPMEAAKGSLSWVFRAKQPESVRTGP